MDRALCILLVLGCLSGCGAFTLPLKSLPHLVVLLLPAHGNLFAATGEGTHYQQRGFILGGPQTLLRQLTIAKQVMPATTHRTKIRPSKKNRKCSIPEKTFFQ